MCALITCTKNNEENEVLADVRESIKTHRLIEPGDTVIAAVSGGADSVCLLHCLTRLRDEFGFRLKAAHLNHGIRGDEADQDEAFVKELCETLEIPLVIRHVDVPGLSVGRNLEETAREERYRFFSDITEEHTKIAVAHNRNDAAETMLMRLVRGTSVEGLGGIRIRNGAVIRPLIHTTREDILRYLEKNGIPFRTDSSNLSDRYTRNYIRHRVLPILLEHSPGGLSAMARTAENLCEAADFIRETARERYGELSDELDCEKVLLLPKVLGDSIIASTAYAAGIRELSAEAIAGIRALCGKPSGKKRMLAGGFEAWKIYGKIVFKVSEEAVPYCVEIRPGNTYIEEAGYTVSLIRAEKGMNLSRLPGKLYARPRKAGDRIAPPGMTGTKKIKELYVAEKLPADKRERYPLLISGDAVVYALGHCDRNYISDHTTKDAWIIKITEGIVK